jgi:uncharacterized membrane protein
MTDNPYAAPRARVEDRVGELAGTFTPRARSVSAGRGWGWVSEGFALFRRQPLTWVLITLVLIALGIATAFIPILGGLALQVLTPVFSAGLMLACRQIEEGGELTVGALFSGFSAHTGRLIGLGALGLVATVLVFAVVGLVLGLGVWALLGAQPSPEMGAEGVLTILLGVLIGVALSIPIYMAMWFSPALIALNHLSLGEAIASSFGACLRNILPFLVYGVVMLLFTVVALIPIGLGLLVLLPVLFTSVYASYRDLFFEP